MPILVLFASMVVTIEGYEIRECQYIHHNTAMRLSMFMSPDVECPAKIDFENFELTEFTSE